MTDLQTQLNALRSAEEKEWEEQDNQLTTLKDNLNKANQLSERIELISKYLKTWSKDIVEFDNDKITVISHEDIEEDNEAKVCHSFFDRCEEIEELPFVKDISDRKFTYLEKSKRYNRIKEFGGNIPACNTEDEYIYEVNVYQIY